jgi:hypothetical protein
MEQFEMTTYSPKRILHTKIGFETADGTVSILHAVVSEGAFFKTFP